VPLGRVFVLSFGGNVLDDTWYLGYKPKYFGAFSLFMFVCLFLTRQPPVGQGLLIYEVSRLHTTTQHSRWDSSGRVIS